MLLGATGVKAVCRTLIKLSPRVDFTNVLQAAFTPVDPLSVKRYFWLNCSFFTLLGSMSVKAVLRKLMKLSPGRVFVISELKFRVNNNYRIKTGKSGMPEGWDKRRKCFGRIHILDDVPEFFTSGYNGRCQVRAHLRVEGVVQQVVGRLLLVPHLQDCRPQDRVRIVEAEVKRMEVWGRIVHNAWYKLVPN